MIEVQETVQKISCRIDEDMRDIPLEPVLPEVQRFSSPVER